MNDFSKLKLYRIISTGSYLLYKMIYHWGKNNCQKIWHSIKKLIFCRSVNKHVCLLYRNASMYAIYYRILQNLWKQEEIYNLFLIHEQRNVLHVYFEFADRYTGLLQIIYLFPINISTRVLFVNFGIFFSRAVK